MNNLNNLPSVTFWWDFVTLVGLEWDLLGLVGTLLGLWWDLATEVGLEWDLVTELRLWVGLVEAVTYFE